MQPETAFPLTGERSRGTQRRVRRMVAGLVPYLLVGPAFLLVGVIILYPAVQTIALSFQDWSFNNPDDFHFVGLTNYQHLFADPMFWSAVHFTVIFTVSVVVLVFAIGLGSALLLHRLVRIRSFALPITILPYMVAGVAVGLVWRLLFEKQYGLVNFFLGLMGIPPTLWLGEAVPGMIAIVVAEVWRSAPFTMLILLAGRLSLPEEVYEAARVDGASSWTTFVHITMPLLLPSAAVALIFQTVFALRIFDIALILTNGGPGVATLPLGILIYRQYFSFGLAGTAEALGVVLLLTGLVLSMIYARALYRDAQL